MQSNFKTRISELHQLISRYKSTAMIESGIDVDRYIDPKTDQRIQKQSYTRMAIWFLAKKPKQFNGERRIFSTNGAETVGYPYVKEEKKNEY